MGVEEAHMLGLQAQRGNLCFRGDVHWRLPGRSSATSGTRSSRTLMLALESWMEHSTGSKQVSDSVSGEPVAEGPRNPT